MMPDLLLTLHGTAFDMGRQHAQQVQPVWPKLQEVIQARLGLLQRLGADLPRSLLPAHQALEEWDRPLLDFLAGLAEGLGRPVGDLVRYTLSSYLTDLHKVSGGRGQILPDGCTTWAASGPATADGRPILAKNRDYHQDHIPLQSLAWVDPADGYDFVSLGSAGSPHVFSSGINERGLVIADTHVLSTDIGPGLPRFSLMREVLQHHDSTGSALDYLRSVQHMGAGTLVLADVRGHLAVCESGHAQSGYLEAASGPFLASTNHFVTPPLADRWVEDEPPIFQGNSPARRTRILAALQADQGHVDSSWAKSLMTAHGTPQDAICRHPFIDPDQPHHPSLESSTIASILFLPQGLPDDPTPALLLADGQPCLSPWTRWTVAARG